MLTAENSLKALVFASIPLILTALFLLIIIVSQQLASPHTLKSIKAMSDASPDQASGKREVHKAEGIPVGVDIVEASQTKVGGNNEQNRGYYKMGTYEWASTIIQFLIFVAAIIYSFVAYRQWLALQDATEQTKQLAATAAIQADVASAANRIARDTLEISQRAYVNIENVTFDGFRSGGPFVIHWKIRNAGHMPATGVQEMFAQNWGPHAAPAPGGRFLEPSRDFGDVIGSEEERHYDTTITGEYPKDLHIPEKLKLTPEKIRAALAGNGSFGLIIAASYFDGFGKARTTWRTYNWDSTLRAFVEKGSRQE